MPSDNTQIEKDDDKKKKWKSYAFFILLTEGLGIIAGLLTRQGASVYAKEITKPLFSPPGIVFPIAWSILYLFMAIGMAMVWNSEKKANKVISVVLYFAQLVLNYSWCFIFFTFRFYKTAFVWIVMMFAVVSIMSFFFKRSNKSASLLQVPYTIWLIFAGYLSLGVWFLNSK